MNIIWITQTDINYHKINSQKVDSWIKQVYNTRKNEHHSFQNSKSELKSQIHLVLTMFLILSKVLLLFLLMKLSIVLLKRKYPVAN